MALTVEMVGLVSVGDLISTAVPTTFVLTDGAEAVSGADMAMTVDPPLTRDRRTVPVRASGFDVPDYLVVKGRPVARNGLWAVAAPSVGVGTPGELEPFPEPRNVALEVTARWLPIEATFNPSVTLWSPWSEYLTAPSDGYTVDQLRAFNVGEVGIYRVRDLLVDGTLIIRSRSDFAFHSTTGAAPAFRPRFDYWRAGSMIRNGSISMDGGQYFWTDDIPWASPEVTVVVAAVLRQPKGEWYSILETAHPLTSVLDYSFSLRYSRSGTLALWSDQVLATMDLATGFARPAQPVIVGFNLDMVNNTCTLMSVDTGVQVVTVNLPQRIDPVSRLFLGRSPLGQQANAVMDVLEVGYSDQQYGPGQINKLLAAYDRMYGVSAS
jgi:hypothetical protein